MIKLPKWYQASGFRLIIKKGDLREDKGHFILEEEEILINKEQFDRDYNLLETFVHECLEASICANGFVWENKPGLRSVGILRHEDLTVVAQELARGILDLIELNRK